MKVTVPGVTAFTQLSDVPHTFLGASLKNVSVNSGETGLTFSTGGGGTPGGSDTQIQYNSTGSFAGSSAFTWTDASKLLTIGAVGGDATINYAGDASLYITGTGISTAIQLHPDAFKFIGGTGGNRAALTTTSLTAQRTFDFPDVAGTIALTSDLASKQDTLVSGTNIKTVNGNNLLGSGDVTISSSVAWGSITGTLSSQTDLNTALNGKVTGNTAITGATKTKVTYDTKGLVTAGADATTADIADSTNKRYVTDAQLTVIGNTSGTNSGDNAVNSLYSGLVSNATHTGDATGATALTVVGINGTILSSLATGVLKNTTTTGVPFISKVALTEPATAATLTIANNQTLTVNGSTTLTNGTHSGTNTGDQTISITGDVTASGSTGALSATVTKINGTALSGLATGILKNTTSTGVPSIATDGTDYYSSSQALPNANIQNGINNGASALQSQVVVSGTAYYITNSALTMPASSKTNGGMSTTTRLTWRVFLGKTAAGTGTFQLAIYRGTNGTTGDTQDVLQTLGTQTAAIDTMWLDVSLTVTATGASGSYFWTITGSHAAASGVGFGIVNTAVQYWTGTKSAIAMNTASLKFGLGFVATTGTPTITAFVNDAHAWNMS